jgi:hypothetical protein
MDRLAQTLVSRGDTRRSPTETPVAEKIMVVLVVVLSHRSMMKNPPWRGSENA